MKKKVLVFYVLIAFISGASYCLGESKGRIRVLPIRKAPKPNGSMPAGPEQLRLFILAGV